MIYPFDNIMTGFYRKFEREVYFDENKKYFRKPKSKKYYYLKFIENKELDFKDNELFIFPYKTPDGLNSEYTYFFECVKGNLIRNTRVYKGKCNDEITGYVLRSSFLYSIGRLRCIIVLSIRWDDSQEYYGVNIKSTVRYKIIKV